MSRRSDLEAPDDDDRQSGHTTLEQFGRCLDALDARLAGSREVPHGLEASALQVEQASDRPPRDATPGAPEGGDRFYRLSALADRLEQIGRAIDCLPETLSLRSLEEKLLTLATAVEHLVSRPPAFGGETFTQIEVRLDEISSAIAASGFAAVRSAHVDPEPFRRIEARIGALAGQIEEVARERPAGEVVERLGALSQSFDEMALRMQLPEQALERLSGQVAAVAKKIDLAAGQPDAGSILSGIGDRFELLSFALERRHGELIEQGSLLMREIGRRLDAVAAGLAHESAAPGLLPTLLSGIEERFDALERRQTEALEQGSRLLHELESRLDAVGDGLEPDRIVAADALLRVVDSRLAALAERLEERVRGNGVAGLEGRLEDLSQRLDRFAGRFAGLHSEMIGGLGAQAAGLSTLLSRPSAQAAGSEAVGRRPAEIERRIADSGERQIEAACRSAEMAVRRLAGNQLDATSAAALADRLEALDALARRFGDDGSRAIKAIHDTLITIAGRLSAERGADAERGGQPADHPPPGAGETVPPPALAVRKAPAAAAAAPLRSLDDAVLPPSGRRRFVRSMLGGLFPRWREGEAGQRPGEAEAGIRGETSAASAQASLDPRRANRPLEPGSRPSGIDVPARSAQEEGGRSAQAGGSDAPISDFIAAARRAAQASVGEAAAPERKSHVEGPAKVLHLGGLLRAASRPLLMAGAGIALALAGMELGRTFVSDPVATAVPPESGRAGRGAASLAGPASLRAERMPVLAADVGVKPGAPASAAPASAALAIAVEVPVTAGPAALRRAANSGDPAALFEVASRLAEGRGTARDLPEAAKWYEKAANLGLASAQVRIGNFYEKGTGVARDIARSKAWYERAAAQGNASAMHHLAMLLATGADGAVDSEGAAAWFVSAAELGVQVSQFNLGVLAARGVGMARDLEASYKWFALAARSGDGNAAGKRDEVARALRPEQLGRARAAVERWRPEPLDAGANAVDVPKEWLDDGAALADTPKPVGDVRLIQGGKEPGAGRAAAAGGAGARIAAA